MSYSSLLSVLSCPVSADVLGLQLDVLVTQGLIFPGLRLPNQTSLFFQESDV